jgi:stage V sporulation protein R
MYHTRHDKELSHIEERILHFANEFGRTLPEIKFLILDGNEFISLLEKKVYPCSPMNIWEGKNVIKRKFMADSGQESSIYYEVVQTGRPSYAYLNNTNSPTTQASVMAHVIGHCEFSELNVMHDSDDNRTEKIMFLVKKVQSAMEWTLN